MAAEVVRRPQDHFNGGRDLYPSQGDDQDLENYGLPSHLTVDNEHIKELARYFIINGLYKNGFVRIARRLQRVENPDDETHHIIQSIAAEFERERSKQFEDIFTGLCVNDKNLKVTYNTVLSELFRDGVHWGKIVAFLVFSSHIAVYSAQHNMENRVEDIVEWSELEMQTRIHDWVMDRGGWAAFVEHFDGPETKEWNMTLSSAIFATGMVLTVVAGGLFAIKRLLS